MSTIEEQTPILDGKAPIDISGNYQPIHLEDTVGAIFLGILALISLVGWVRAEGRYRILIAREERHPLNA